MKTIESALVNLMLQRTERVAVNIYPELWAGLRELARMLNTSAQLLAGACLLVDAEPLDELKGLEDKIWSTLDLIRGEPAYRYLYFKLTETNPQFHPSPPVRRNAIVPEKTEPPTTFEANFRIAHALYHHPLAKRLRAYPLIEPIYEHLLKVLKAEIRIKSNWITAIENFAGDGKHDGPEKEKTEDRPDEIRPRPREGEPTADNGKGKKRLLESSGEEAQQPAPVRSNNGERGERNQPEVDNPPTEANAGNNVRGRGGAGLGSHTALPAGPRHAQERTGGKERPRTGGG